MFLHNPILNNAQKIEVLDDLLNELRSMANDSRAVVIGEMVTSGKCYPDVALIMLRELDCR